MPSKKKPVSVHITKGVDTPDYKEWFFRDHSKYVAGPWMAEPDKVQFRTKTGLWGLIVRNHFGNLCGYVGVPEGHRFYEVGYGECHLHVDHNAEYDWEECTSPEKLLSVHGGITFADHCASGEPVDGICHVAPPEEGKVWWLGFDCAHGGDVSPGILGMLDDDDYRIMKELDGTKTYLKWRSKDVYRDIAYVKAEIEQLAEQLVALP